jgi:hypothetical protein
MEIYYKINFSTQKSFIYFASILIVYELIKISIISKLINIMIILEQILINFKLQTFRRQFSENKTS